MNIKNFMLTAFSVLFSLVSCIDKPLVALIILMTLDLISGGFIIPFILNKSPKSEGGGASSYAGFVGIAKKCLILFCVLAGRVVDFMCGTDIVYIGIVFAFSANEVLSLIENAGIAGIPIPPILADGVEILKGKGDAK